MSAGPRDRDEPSNGVRPKPVDRPGAVPTTATLDAALRRADIERWRRRARAFAWASGAGPDGAVADRPD